MACVFNDNSHEYKSGIVGLERRSRSISKSKSQPGIGERQQFHSGPKE